MVLRASLGRIEVAGDDERPDDEQPRQHDPQRDGRAEAHDPLATPRSVAAHKRHGRRDARRRTPRRTPGAAGAQPQPERFHLRRVDRGANLVLGFRATPNILRYVVEKGSIAIDGISLTVNHVDRDSFDVAIIPHTRDHTTLGARNVGQRVNLEVDLVAKYVEKFTVGYRGTSESEKH